MLKIGMCPNPFQETEWHTQANPSLIWQAKVIEATGIQIIPLTAKQVLNPQKLMKMGIQVLHLHWPSAVFNFYVRRWQVQKILPGKLVEIWARYQLKRWEILMRKSRIPMVWEVHDLLSHHAVGYNYAADLLLHHTFYRQASGLIVHGDHCYAPIRDFFRADKPYVVAALGSYRALYGEPLTKEEARRQLGISCSGKIFAYMGSARPMRNPEKAAKAFIESASENDIFLVAGVNLDKYVNEEMDKRIKVFHGFLSVAQFHQILCAVDFVINDAPQYLTSAIIRTAMSYGRPVIAFPFGSALDMAEGAALWLDDSPDSLFDIIRRASEMEDGDWERLSKKALQHEADLTWEDAGSACKIAYEQALKIN